MRAKGVPIKKEWLVPELYGYQVPPAILKTLALKSPFESSRKPQKIPHRTMTEATPKGGGINSDFNQIDQSIAKEGITINLTPSQKNFMSPKHSSKQKNMTTESMCSPITTA
jgi:hypothetical protein